MKDGDENLKWTDPKRITIPDGMIRVTRGKVQKGDRIYHDPDAGYKDDPKLLVPVRDDIVGTPVGEWWLIVRSVP